MTYNHFTKWEFNLSLWKNPSYDRISCFFESLIIRINFLEHILYLHLHLHLVI